MNIQVLQAFEFTAETSIVLFTILIIILAFVLVAAGAMLEIPGLWVFSGILFMAAALIPLEQFFIDPALPLWYGNMHFVMFFGLGALFILLGAYAAWSSEA